MEASGAECDFMNCGVLIQDVLEENYRMLSRGCSCNILVKYLAAFFHCPKNRSEAKSKEF